MIVSKSFNIAKKYLNKKVEVEIDRPLGSKHPKYEFIYEVNYGFIKNVKVPDGEDLDAYCLGIKEPVKNFTGVCVAIVHRKDDNDDKLIILPEGVEMTDEEIMDNIYFQEQWFDTKIIRGDY
ncbi:MAG: inorganic pyrophosphatase [Candidatus ainarchaeum sp.]|nr:inorganic pyrophosphatase [Candidatus ainarchaeum sp.]